MKNKLLLILLIVALSLSMAGTAYAKIEKSETIYVKLNYDGSIDHTTVVNRLHGTTSDDNLVDYGNYKNVKSLDDNTDGLIEDNKVIWPSSVLDGDFYYEGNIDIELPYNYQIKYYLDGNLISATDLAGKDGKFKIEITTEKNDNYRNSHSLSSQLNIELDLDKFSNIQCNNGTSITVGKTMTINYMLLPNQTGNFVLEAEGKDIELDPITITLVPYSFTLPTDLEEGFDDLKEMEDGAEELVEKNKIFEEGIQDITGSINDLASGTGALKEGINEVSGGFKEVSDGTSDLKSSTSLLSETSNQLSMGLTTANESSSDLVDGYKGLKINLDTSLEMSDQMIESANKLIESGIPEYVQLGQQLLAQIEELKQLSDTMEQLNKGFSDYVAGITEVEEGLKTFNQQAGYLPSGIDELKTGLDSLDSGINDLTDGIYDLHDGINALNNKTKTLPENSGKLVEGQQRLKDGINTMNAQLEEKLEGFSERDQESISYIEPNNPMETDVQIIIQTPSIKAKEIKVIEVVQEKKKTIWDRFLDLFK